MDIIEETPLFPQEGNREEKASSRELSDLIIEISIPLFGDIDDGRATIRGALIKAGKYYIDNAKTKERVQIKETNKEAIIYLKPKEKRLSDILDCIPYGLINKQLTGIGATYLEMHSNRNSIIVTPTRTLAYNKSISEENKYLYVGTKLNGRVTSEKEILDYLNNNIQPKKILVVADSLHKVIKAITKNKEDIYKDYFLMVDEIDTLQSDNHFRPQLSNVVDYYFKFSQDKRALVSATVKSFSHPQLTQEPYITITSQTPLKRKINLLHSNNINQSLSKEIIRLVKAYPTDKILIAYNSVQNALKTIKLLTDIPKDNLGILCSEASINEAGSYKATIENDKLSHKITFMTCAFFAGIDIKDKCHLITVSNTRKGYSILSLNKITQIHGRCRLGILSDTIIYNTNQNSFKYIFSYKTKLKHKAQKVIDLLSAADKLKINDNDIVDLFNRIEKIIIEKADERFFYDTPISLVRNNIDLEREISYFNIDALCEQMEVYTSLYTNEDDLYKALLQTGNEVTFKRDIHDTIEDVKENYVVDNELILNKIESCRDFILDLKVNNALNDDILDEKIRQSKRQESVFYERVKLHYKYVSINFLTKKLYDISLENKKSYRGVKNAVSFWILEDNHPFKMQILEAFKDYTRKYSSQEITELLQPIIKYHFFKTLTQSRLVGLFKVFFNCTYTQGQYLIKGDNPLAIPQPIQRISSKEEILYNYFDI